MNTLAQRKLTASSERTSPPPLNTKLVYAEFVYYDREGAARDVQIAGDWSEWACLALTCEAERFWKGVFVVPVGYHEFVFYVNGAACVSETHPKTARGNTNWRRIAGSSAASKSKQNSDSLKSMNRTVLRSVWASVSNSLNFQSSSSLSKDPGLTESVFGDVSDLCSSVSSSSLSDADEEMQSVSSALLSKSPVRTHSTETSSSWSFRPAFCFLAFLVVYLFLYASIYSKLT